MRLAYGFEGVFDHDRSERLRLTMLNLSEINKSQLGNALC